MPLITIATIRIDAGTQIRAAISEPIVAEYAERMSEGVTFPPVVLFHDGNEYYMADGFHRCLASARVGFRQIEAEIHGGTKLDALWFALGANKANGHRMTSQDKRHAIELALSTWPDKSANALSEQIGVNQNYVSEIRRQVSATTNLPDRVIGKDGKSYPVTKATKPEQPRDGRSLDKSRAGIQQRRDRMREMAAEGYTSRQIAAALGLSDEGCRQTIRDEGIDVPADRATKGTQRPNATRIVASMVMDAENLTADIALIDFDDLDTTRLREWVTSLRASRNKLDSFIKRLQKEQDKHGEAA